MEFIDLNNNIRNKENSTSLYDINTISFSYKPEVLLDNYKIYYVDEFEEMRMDLVCNSIYGNVNHVDFLCNINDIFNPLSIKKDMIIIYVDENLIPAFRPDRIDKTEIRKKISNKRKQTKIDPNRVKYLSEKDDSLPPTVTRRDYNPVKYKDGKISIGDGIFGI